MLILMPLPSINRKNNLALYYGLSDVLNFFIDYAEIMGIYISDRLVRNSRKEDVYHSSKIEVYPHSLV